MADDRGGYWAHAQHLVEPIPMTNGVEILCHNLSHSDLVLSVNDHSMSHPNGKHRAFSLYESFETDPEILRRQHSSLASDIQNQFS